MRGVAKILWGRFHFTHFCKGQGWHLMDANEKEIFKRIKPVDNEFYPKNFKCFSAYNSILREEISKMELIFQYARFLRKFIES